MPAPLRGMLGQVSAILAHRTLSSLTTLRPLPSLVITGTADSMVRPLNSEHLASALDAELLCFAGSGHAIHVEQAEAVNAALRGLFARGGAALAG